VLAPAGLSVCDIDVVVAAPGRPAYLKALASGLGLPEERLVGCDAAIHTAGVLAAFDRAAHAGRLRPGARVLLAAGAPGINAGAALYCT
jgi:3-oxoacyl-[acyl-carrier-protein] synthase-3